MEAEPSGCSTAALWKRLALRGSRGRPGGGEAGGQQTSEPVNLSPPALQATRSVLYRPPTHLMVFSACSSVWAMSAAAARCAAQRRSVRRASSQGRPACVGEWVGGWVAVEGGSGLPNLPAAECQPALPHARRQPSASQPAAPLPREAPTHPPTHYCRD